MKKENLKTIALITAVVLVVASVIGAFVIMSGEHEGIGEGNGNNTGGGENNTEENEGTYVHTIGREYDVIIKSKGNYTLYLPIPVNETGISYIMDNFTLVKGNCTYRIENTTYGLALNVTGRGYVEFRAIADYTMYVENWKVVNTSGVNPETHPITLSMSNITYIHDGLPSDYTNATGYNTTKIPFKIPQYWKNWKNDGYLMYPHWVNVHSFIYIRSEMPVNVSLSLSGVHGIWSLSGTFTENGWHYVELDLRELPQE